MVDKKDMDSKQIAKHNKKLYMRAWRNDNKISLEKKQQKIVAPQTALHSEKILLRQIPLG